jgi:hypothetical protein
MSDSRSSELNEILEGRPSRFAFRVLRTLLDTWPEHTDRDEAIRQAEAALAQWPARTRHVSAGSNREMSALLRQPSWRLVRSLQWVPLGDATTLQVVADLASDPNAEYLRRLLLGFPSDEVLQGLRLRTCFPKLITLSVDLGCDNERKTVIPFLSSGLPSSLRYLNLNGTRHLDDGMSDDVPEIIDVIASSPVTRRLRAISLPNMSEVTLDRFMERFRVPLSDIGHQEWTLESLERLCRHRELASGLKRLSLLARHLGDEGVALLAHCPHFARLEYLNLGGNAVGPRGLAALAGSSILPNLRWLNLFDNPLGDDGWEILGRSPFQRLRTLALWWTEATALGARSLAQSENLHRLRGLILAGNQGLGDEGISQILRAPFAMRLSNLNLASTGKSAATAEALASRPLESLRALDLGSDRGGVEFGCRLARSSVFPSLVSLDLQGLGLGDEGVEYLTRSRGFPRLRRLSLWGNGITSRGVRALAESPFASSLRDLSLQSNPAIDDEGAIALAESRFIRNLVDLDLPPLACCGISRVGLEVLRRSPNMRRLETFWFSSPTE